MAKDPNQEQTASGLNPVESSGLSELTEQLKKLVAKIDTPKKKSVWDVIAVLTPFIGTVVLGGLSLYLTQSYQRLEAERAARFNQVQVEMQRAQIRIEELKAITSFAPLLSNRDQHTREIANQVLKAIRSTGTLPSIKQPANEVNLPSTKSASTPHFPVTTSLIDSFAATASSPTLPTQSRVEAIRKIGAIAAATTTSPKIREHAADIVAQIAYSKETPDEVKQIASEIIAKIKQVNASEVEKMISTQPLTREVSEVILHHSATPASSFKGAQSLYSFASFQVEGMLWRHVSWHYAIAPDGSIWLGAPLDEIAIHVGTQNKTSVSVMLIMNGDKEVPTTPQRSSLVVVLHALSTRLKLDMSLDSPQDHGFHFHRDYQKYKNCPGSLLTKEMVISWL
ncbi:N-acetylmuramoyl-L-alanine amidase [Spirosoma taeanense]|uniref:N-acetylmuramoyl-L-alanine amidase n=1 Tax=Spirosoma taeanense TaxID=2735870 RepID=A0A6M5Y9C9_9BACT|nr:peptidoglycan recognition family protein [Spirosoma taeanense]QJW90585.1 N-acetylmuramoyl-L-alanine amidase [Spirosoma taeanense]